MDRLLAVLAFLISQRLFTEEYVSEAAPGNRGCVWTFTLLTRRVAAAYPKFVFKVTDCSRNAGIRSRMWRHERDSQ